MAHNYPTEEGIKFAIEQGWSKEQAERGFEIFDFDGLDLLEIEAIGDCYPDQIYDDEAAAREAERTGYCKIIPVNELPDPFIIDEISRRYFGWVDTPENRKRIESFTKENHMSRRALAFETHRTGYGIDQIADSAITVKELKNFLEDYPDDMLVVFKNDHGYTYGNFDLDTWSDGVTIYRERYDEEYDETEFVEE